MCTWFYHSLLSRIGCIRDHWQNIMLAFITRPECLTDGLGPGWLWSEDEFIFDENATAEVSSEVARMRGHRT